jgi:hypothetical protein
MPATAGSIAEVTIGDCTGLKHRICISCRSAELERRIADWCFPDVRGGHGFGLVGTHERRIWHGRYRRACDRRLHGRLCLRLSRGLSGQGGRGASNAPARGERGAAQAAWPGEGLIRSCSRRNEGSPYTGIAIITMVHLRVSLPHDLGARIFWKSGNAVVGGSDRGACRDRGVRATCRIA